MYTCDVKDEIISVRADRLEEATAQLEKMIRKANKHSLEKIDFLVGDSYPKQVHTERGKVLVNFVDILVQGVAPHIEGYDFVSKVEFQRVGDETKALLFNVPGQELPLHFHNTDQRCEHCHINRYRSAVFILQDKQDGSYIQVGSTCLKDFLGEDVAGIMSRFQFLKKIRSGFGQYGTYHWYEGLTEVLALTNAAIRIWGWVPKSSPTGEPTAYAICAAWSDDPIDRENRRRLLKTLCDDDYAIADQVIDWVRNQMVADNNYTTNLKIMFASNIVEARSLGFVCSAVAGYHRAMEREALLQRKQEEAAQSEWMGEIKERLRNIEVEIIGHRALNTAWGESMLYKFVDQEGNRYAWFASDSWLNWFNGDKFPIDGTVKAHNEFRGIKETVLTRVKRLD